MTRFPTPRIPVHCLIATISLALASTLAAQEGDAAASFATLTAEAGETAAMLVTCSSYYEFAALIGEQRQADPGFIDTANRRAGILMVGAALMQADRAGSEDAAFDAAERQTRTITELLVADYNLDGDMQRFDSIWDFSARVEFCGEQARLVAQMLSED